MKLLIGWTEVNGYMAACWRELLADPEIELLIVAGKPGSLLANNSYCIDGFDDLPIRYLDPEQFHGRCIENIANEFKPDVICMPGWSFSGFRRLAFQKDFSNCRIVLASDNPFRSSLRQRIGRFVLRRFLNRMDMVIVPGERGWQLARYFRIRRQRFAAVCTALISSDWHHRTRNAKHKTLNGRVSFYLSDGSTARRAWISCLTPINNTAGKLRIRGSCRCVEKANSRNRAMESKA